MVISFTQKANSQVLISLLLGDKLNSEKLKFGLDGGVNFATISKEDLSYKYNVHDEYNRIDAGVKAGIGYNVIKGTQPSTCLQASR
jgi:hypothetical protein